MPLKVEDQISDCLTDDVGLLLRELHAIANWPAKKNQLFEHLMLVTKRERYFRFAGDHRDYHLVRKGQSCLYDIPLNQLGALRRFRGHRIRLICAGAWDQYAGRFFLAKLVKAKS